MIREITASLERQIHSAATAPRRALESIMWDACVVGSGPGGAVTAATLAQAGWRVLLIERGAYRRPEDANFQLFDMAMRLSRLSLTRGARTTLHAGSTLGGGSLIFGAMAMQPSQTVFDEWAARSGVPGLNRDVLSPHYSAVGETLSVTQQSARAENRANAIVREMAAVLGHQAGLELAMRYTAGCRGTGLCTLGCGFNLKGTMVNSFLPIGLGTGNLTILTECEATAFDVESSRTGQQARALHVTMTDGTNRARSSGLRVRAKHFITSTGSLSSSALLIRSRVRGRLTQGGRVSLQPHGVIHALFDEPVTDRGDIEDGRYVPRNGVPAIYNFTGLLDERRYYWFASSLHPSSLATYTAYLSPQAHRSLMSRFHYTSSITVTLRDDPDRSRVVMRRGTPQLDFCESERDRASLRRCFADAARALLAVGARRVFLPMLEPPRIQRECDVALLEREPMSYDRLILYSDHTSGGNCIGADRRRGVTDAYGRVHGITNIHVADASLFPSACGVAPSWTIMALARMIALNLAQRG